MQADGHPGLLGQGAQGVDGSSRAPGHRQGESAVAEERPARGMGAAVHEDDATLGQASLAQGGGKGFVHDRPGP